MMCALALSLLLLAPLSLTMPTCALSSPQVPEEGREAEEDVPKARVLLDEEELSFSPPKALRSGDSCFLGLAVEGCSLMSLGSGLLVPVKAMVFRLPWTSRLLDLRVEVARVRVISLPGQPVAATFLPAAGTPSPSRPIKQAQLARPKDLVPNSWYEWELHYGLDPADLERKTFLVVRFFPVRYDLAHERALFASSARVLIKAEVREAPAPLQGEAEGALDTLIITSEELMLAARELAAHRNASGIRTAVRTVEWIGERYEGRDLPEKIRSFVREAVEALGVRFLLILGDHDVVPTRLVQIPDGFEDDRPEGDGCLVETDLYYADVYPEVSWDDDGDGSWGELPDERIDAFPDVFVGRLPASTLEEAWSLVEKLVHYDLAVRRARDGWVRRAVLAGVDLFKEPGWEGSEGEAIKEGAAALLAEQMPRAVLRKLYEGFGNLTREKLLAELAEGCSLLDFAGHGGPGAWFLGQEVLTAEELTSLTNSPCLPLVIAIACSTSRFSDVDCLGEIALLDEDGGAIAYLGATRVAWIGGGPLATRILAGNLDLLLTRAFVSELPSLGQVWAKALTDYVGNHGISRTFVVDEGSYYLDWKTVAEFGSPLGDPSLLLAKPEYPLGVRCSDADGVVQLAGLRVALSSGNETVSEATTNEEGLAILRAPSAGGYELAAYFSSLRVAKAALVVPCLSPLELACAFYDLNITCLDTEGEPLAGALVLLDLPGLLLANGTTDEHGLLRLKDLPAAEYEVSVVWQRPWPTRVFEASLELEMDEQTANFSCQVFDVVVLVVDLLGRPVEGAKVELLTANGTHVLEARTDSQGRAELEDLARGDYVVRVSAGLAPTEEALFGLRTRGQVIKVRLGRWLSPFETAFSALSALAVLSALALYIVSRRRRMRSLIALGGAPPRSFGGA